MLNGLLEDVRGFVGLSREEKRARFMEALDNRVRIITAGLSIKELRALMRGDPTTERPNPRYRVHVVSFIAHIRPKFYFQASTRFLHNFHLGYFAVLFFFIETITGLILMIYYVPSPAEAYESILIIENNVVFGKLMRDMHRFGAELMVVFVWLHLFRTYFTGSYKGKQTFTWFTGVFLLLTTVILSFSGYLLPWDQLAYWAVTIGTSMADKAPPPALGEVSNLLLRGAPDIGAGGLLRFYLLHVVLLPLVAILLISIHYYKVAREHGISLPAGIEETDLSKGELKDAKKRIDVIPDLLTHEIFLASLASAALLVYLAFFYGGAPLEHHANPLQTPLDTKAPWYFWWIQGMLKLGDPTWMGVIWPTVFVIILLAVPYIDRNPARMGRKRPFAVIWGIFWAIALVVLSYMGTPVFGIETPPAVRIIQDLAPEEGVGMLRAVPFDQLQPGVYFINDTELDTLPPEFAAFFTEYEDRVNQVEERGKFVDPTALVYVSEWQKDLKKVVLRIVWTEPPDSKTGVSEGLKAFEHEFYLHRDRGSE